MDRLSKKLGNLSSNMNVRDEYSEDRKINSKMTTLIGQYKFSNRFRTPDGRGRRQASQENSYDRFLNDGPEKPKNYASELESLVKRRFKIKNVNTNTRVDSLLKDFKERSLALRTNEPMLDCFIKMKRDGHFNRENPAQMVNYPTYTLETRDLPLHKISLSGYKRNRYGKPMLY